MMLKYSLRTIHGRIAEKGFKMAFMMNKLAMNDFCEIIVENKNNKIILKFRCALYWYAHYTL
jgi:hypothetical protein